MVNQQRLVVAFLTASGESRVRTCQVGSSSQCGDNVQLIKETIAGRWIALLASGSSVPVTLAPRCRLARQILRSDLYLHQVQLIKVEILIGVTRLERGGSWLGHQQAFDLLGCQQVRVDAHFIKSAREPLIVRWAIRLADAPKIILAIVSRAGVDVFETRDVVNFAAVNVIGQTIVERHGNGHMRPLIQIKFPSDRNGIYDAVLGE